MINPKFNSAMISLLEHIEGLFVAAKVHDFSGLEVDNGTKYAKIIEVDSEHRRSRVWGFVEISTGDVLKAASYRAPAKHARGNIYDPNTWSQFEWTGPQYINNGRTNSLFQTITFSTEGDE